MRMLKKLQDFYWDQWAYWTTLKYTFWIWRDIFGSNFECDCAFCDYESEEECIQDYYNAFWEGLTRDWHYMNHPPRQHDESDVDWVEQVESTFKDGKLIL